MMSTLGWVWAVGALLTLVVSIYLMLCTKDGKKTLRSINARSEFIAFGMVVTAAAWPILLLVLPLAELIWRVRRADP